MDECTDPPARNLPNTVIMRSPVRRAAGEHAASVFRFTGTLVQDAQSVRERAAMRRGGDAAGECGEGMMRPGDSAGG